METIGRHRWKSYVIYSFNGILQSQFFYSTCVKTTSEGSISAGPNSQSSLKNLLVGSLGFSEKQALSTSTKLNKLRQSRGATKVSGFSFLKNADLVISFLEKKGFTKPQIRNVVYSAPQILTVRIEHTLEPKMKVFQEMGLSESDFADAISTQPGILGYGVDSTIRPALEALKTVMASDEDAVKVFKKFKLYNMTLVSKYLVSNVALLRARNIPINSIRKRILHQSSCFIHKTEELKDIMTQVEQKWGVSPDSPMFLYAVEFLCGHSEKNIESKCQMFERFGWERSDVVELFRQNPNCLAVSEEKIKDVLNFFMNELGYDPGYIVAHPALLSYSLEKRVLPRHSVLQLLKEKGLIRDDFSLYTALLRTETQFLRRFIQCFQDDMPNLHDIYVNSTGSSTHQQSRRGKNSHVYGIELKPASDGQEL